jgi:hypothetical protein
VTDSVFFADPLKVGDPVLAHLDAEDVHFLDGRLGARAARAPSPATAAVASS